LFTKLRENSLHLRKYLAPTRFVARGIVKNIGALRDCASMKPKYLPIRARSGRFLG
jgi:hypothetical protein